MPGTTAPTEVILAVLAEIDAARESEGWDLAQVLYVVGPQSGLGTSRCASSQTIAGVRVHASIPLPDDSASGLWGWNAPEGTQALALASEFYAQGAEAHALIAVQSDGQEHTLYRPRGQAAMLTHSGGGRIPLLLRRCLGLDVPPEPTQVSVADFAAGWITEKVANELHLLHLALPTQGGSIGPGVAERHTLQHAAVLAWQVSDHGRLGPDPQQARLIHRVADGSEPVVVLDNAARRELVAGLRACLADLSWVEAVQRGDTADLLAPLLPRGAGENPAWGGDGLIAAYMSKYTYSPEDFLSALAPRSAQPVRETLELLGLPVR